MDILCMGTLPATCTPEGLDSQAVVATGRENQFCRNCPETSMLGGLEQCLPVVFDPGFQKEKYLYVVTQCIHASRICIFACN